MAVGKGARLPRVVEESKIFTQILDGDYVSLLAKVLLIHVVQLHHDIFVDRCKLVYKGIPERHKFDKRGLS